MKIQTFDSVWDAISDTPEQAENMKVRAQLMQALQNWIERKELSQAEAAEVLGLSQPRVSELMRGKIQLFSVDRLITIMAAVGMHISSIEICETAAA
ncbi:MULTISPECIES: helix-turn-helix domain-containing protein [Dryocola]|jgi:predicted XRE-type DNA-binding protein|uniref:helix-turn-helix domain-containing protein n=1 Tax=Cedecea sulfonylureivorans TaxID=3051154 RepID=UPI0019267E8B|nr:XRE family transcriptional regulator [Cedecea sulfonylureivorans]